MTLEPRQYTETSDVPKSGRSPPIFLLSYLIGRFNQPSPVPEVRFLR